MKSVGLSFCQQARANCDQQKHVAEWILILKSGSFLVNLLRNVCDFTAVCTALVHSAQQCTQYIIITYVNASRMSMAIRICPK